MVEAGYFVWHVVGTGDMCTYLVCLTKTISMENSERQFKMGMVAALMAVRKTLSIYPDGMTAEQISEMVDEIDQQLGIKNTEIQLLKRA